MSTLESGIHTEPFSGSNPQNTRYFRNFEVEISLRVANPELNVGEEFPYVTDGGRLRIDQLSLSFPEGRNPGLEPYVIRPSPIRNLDYYNGVAQVEETTGSRDLIRPEDIASIAYVAYPGALGNGTGLVFDGSFVLPNGSFGFNSNSTPTNFVVPQVGNTPGVNLSAQILAALPPTATGNPVNPIVPIVAVTPIASNTGNGELVASVTAIEGRASAAQEVICPGRQRQVVGRSAGDEADVGATTALRGAPTSVFQTTYALGDVSPQLMSADGASIAGTKRADACL